VLNGRRRGPDRARQIHDRDGFPTHVGDAQHDGMRMRQRGERRALDQLLDLEHIDPEALAATEAKQQEFQAVVARQLGPHVDAVQ